MWFTRKKSARQEPPARSAAQSHGQAGGRGSYSYEPPAGPPPGYAAGVASGYGDGEGYAAPDGPPPHRIQSQGDYAPPQGPPPGRAYPQDDYAPPDGPPPHHTHPQTDYAPPQVPPPSWIRPPPEQHHAPAHDWQTAVPDTSLFPPPPALFSGFDASPANNATAEEAEAGEAWCARYPLLPPAALPAAALAALRAHDIAPVPPAGFPGRATQLRPGRWSVRTGPGTRDACILGYPPLYSAREHAGAPRTVYYEVRVRAGSSANVALGFAALPYPSFRLPGWHRGSLAVHGDDGHRYVNDRWGGRAFTRPFAAGATYGVGVVLGAGGAGSVFFTRDGRREGGWDMHEETDAERDLGVFGLEGRHDLSCAIGCFEDVDLEVVFDPAGWMYALKE